MRSFPDVVLGAHAVLLDAMNSYPLNQESMNRIDAYFSCSPSLFAKKGMKEIYSGTKDSNCLVQNVKTWKSKSTEWQVGFVNGLMVKDKLCCTDGDAYSDVMIRDMLERMLCAVANTVSMDKTSGKKQRGGAVTRDSDDKSLLALVILRTWEKMLHYVILPLFRMKDVLGAKGVLVAFTESLEQIIQTMEAQKGQPNSSQHATVTFGIMVLRMYAYIISRILEDEILMAHLEKIIEDGGKNTGKIIGALATAGVNMLALASSPVPVLGTLVSMTISIDKNMGNLVDVMDGLSSSGVNVVKVWKDVVLEPMIEAVRKVYEFVEKKKKEYNVPSLSSYIPSTESVELNLRSVRSTLGNNSSLTSKLREKTTKMKESLRPKMLKGIQNLRTKIENSSSLKENTKEEMLSSLDTFTTKLNNLPNDGPFRALAKESIQSLKSRVKTEAAKEFIKNNLPIVFRFA